MFQNSFTLILLFALEVVLSTRRYNLFIIFCKINIIPEEYSIFIFILIVISNICKLIVLATWPILYNWFWTTNLQSSTYRLKIENRYLSAMEIFIKCFDTLSSWGSDSSIATSSRTTSKVDIDKFIKSHFLSLVWKQSCVDF